MPSVKIDGTDFFAVYAATQDAVARARCGDGPSTIETVAKRWHGHYSGDPQHYRSKTERSALFETDPLRIFRERVLGERWLVPELLDRVDRESEVSIEEAVQEAAAAPFPGVEDTTTQVYVSY